MAELEVCRNLSLEKGKWSVFTVLFRSFWLVISCFSPTWIHIHGVVHTFLWVPADLYAAESDA